MSSHEDNIEPHYMYMMLLGNCTCLATTNNSFEPRNFLLSFDDSGQSPFLGRIQETTCGYGVFFYLLFFSELHVSLPGQGQQRTKRKPASTGPRIVRLVSLGV